MYYNGIKTNTSRLVSEKCVNPHIISAIKSKSSAMPDFCVSFCHSQRWEDEKCCDNNNWPVITHRAVLPIRAQLFWSNSLRVQGEFIIVCLYCYDQGYDCGQHMGTLRDRDKTKILFNSQMSFFFTGTEDEDVFDIFKSFALLLLN